MKRITCILLALMIVACLPSCSHQGTPTADTRQELTSPLFPGSHGTAGLGADLDGNSPGSSITGSEPSPVPVRKVTVELDGEKFARGAIVEPHVIFTPSGATDTSYTLRSSDETVVSYIGGSWIAVGAGEAELIATAANGVTGSTGLTVIVPVESLTPSADAITIDRGQSVLLTVVVHPEDATELELHYIYGDENVVTVSPDGMIYALAAGTAEIQCVADAASVTVRVNVTVPVEYIRVDTDRQIYMIGDQGSVFAQIGPDDATDKTFTVDLSGDAARLTGENSFACIAGGEVAIIVTATNGTTGNHTITIIDPIAFANEVVRLTNIERANAGLVALVQTPELTRAAVVRADESALLFSHDRPDGSSCFTALDENNVTYRWAGENLAMGQKTPAEVVQDWMDSPGHRENILTAEFGRLGVGVIMDSSGRLYWSQCFTD